MTSQTEHSNASAISRRILLSWVGAAGGRARLVCILVLLSTVFALYYTATNLRINSSTTDLLSEELTFRQNDRAFTRAFPNLEDSLAIIVEGPTPGLTAQAAEQLAAVLERRTDRFSQVFYPDGTVFFRRNGLLYLDLPELQSLSEQLAQAQPLLATLADDPSLRGLAELLAQAAEADDVEAAAAFERLAASIESVAAGDPQPVDWRALISGEASDDSARRAIITVYPLIDQHSLAPLAEAQRSIDSTVTALGLTDEAGYRVRLTGAGLMLQDELESVSTGMGIAGLISVCAVILILSAGLRSWRLVVAILVTLFVGLSWTALFATLAVGELNLISVAFAVLFIGLGVDFAVHFSLRYREARRQGAAHGAALRETAGGVGGPLLLCAFSTAIGFFAFLPTSYEGVSQLGLISGAGMFIALFASLTLLPALITLLAPKIAPLEANSLRPAVQRAAVGLQRLAERHAKVIVALAVLVAVPAAVTLPSAQFDDDPLNLRDPASPSVAALLDLLEDPRIEPYEGKALAPDLAAAETLAGRLAALPEVERALTAADLVPSEQDDKLRVIEDTALFLTPVLLPPERREPSSDTADWSALAALYGALQANQGEISGPAARLAAALQRIGLPDGQPDSERLEVLRAVLLGGLARQLTLLSDALSAEPVTLDDVPAALKERWLTGAGAARVSIIPTEDLRDTQARDRFVDAVLTVAPNATGDPLVISAAGDAVIDAFRQAGLYALVLVSLLLAIVLRSLRDCLLVLVPLLLAGTLTVAATVLLSLPFNFANIIVLPVLLGLGVDSGIHLVTRARESGGGLATSSTPRAVLVSALTTIGSFAALALSEHRGTASMGQLLTITILLTLLTTLIVLPALMALFGVGKNGSQQGSGQPDERTRQKAA